MAEKSEMKAHIATYGGVIALLKWGAVTCAAIVAIVIWLIY